MTENDRQTDGSNETDRQQRTDVDECDTQQRDTADECQSRTENGCEGCPYADSNHGDRFARERYVRSFTADNRAEIERRDVAKLLATVGGLAAAGSLAAPLAGFARVFTKKKSGPVYSENVALVDGQGNRIQEGRLGIGEHLTVFPETNPDLANAPTLLVRYKESAYGGGTNLEYTVGGYAAYSMVCTHAGCIVDGRQDNILVCPCHGGRYNPLLGAKVVGGPPPRNLPQLPITVSSDGYLIATGSFPAPIGPGGN